MLRQSEFAVPLQLQPAVMEGEAAEEITLQLENVELFASPDGEGGRREQPGATSRTHGSASSGVGSLTLTTKRCVFETGTERVTILYPTVVLHAIARDPAAFPKPCTGRAMWLYYLLSLSTSLFSILDFQFHSLFCLRCAAAYVGRQVLKYLDFNFRQHCIYIVVSTRPKLGSPACLANNAMEIGCR